MKQTAGDTDARNELSRLLEAGLNGAFRKDDIDREPVGNTIAHRFESALSLLRFTRIECQSKLNKTIRRQIEFVVERFPNPAAAIVGAKDMILDNKNTREWFLNHNLAIGHEDREVDNSGFRPELKPLSYGLCMLCFDEVISALLRRTASANEPVLYVFVLERSHRIFHHCLLIGSQLVWNADACHTDAWIDLREESSLQRVFLLRTAERPGYTSFGIDRKLKDEHQFVYRVGERFRRHSFLLVCWQT